MINLYPAIDLYDGECVRLKQGKLEEKTIFPYNPIELAQSFVSAGIRNLHMVDLMGAFEHENSKNIKVVQEISKKFGNQIKLQIGGGIKNEELAQNWLEGGVSRVVVSTMAANHPEQFTKLCERFGSERISVSCDVKDGFVATKGWTEKSVHTTESFIEFLNQFKGLNIVYTDISRDGLLQGVNWEGVERVAGFTIPENKIIISGGVHSVEDIKKADKLPKNIEGIIIGRAFYDQKITLQDMIECQSFFSK